MASVAPGAELKGRVLEWNSLVPVEQAQVALRRADGALAGTVETGEKGEFRFAGTPSGLYRIEFSKAGYATTAVLAAVDGDEVFVVRLAAGGTIAGRVTNAEGTAVVGARVLAMLPGPDGSVLPFRGPGSEGVAVDDRGLYRLSGLPPGRYAVAVSSLDLDSSPAAGIELFPNSGTPRTFSVAGGEEYRNIDFVTSPVATGALRGRVTLPDRAGVVLVAIVPRDGPSMATAKTVADQDGVFQFPSIPAGRYSVIAAGPSSGNGGMAGILDGDPFFGRADLDVAPGSESNIEVGMERGRTLPLRLAGEDTCAGGSATVHLWPTDGGGAQLDRQIPVNSATIVKAAGLAPVRYAVGVSGQARSCFYSGDATIDVSKAGDDVVSIRVSPGASIDGRIAAAVGRLPTDYLALVWQENPEGDDAAYLLASPDSQGRFSIPNLRPGTYRAVAIAREEWSGVNWKLDVDRSKELRLAAGRVAHVELSVGPFAELRGPGGSIRFVADRTARPVGLGRSGSLSAEMEPDSLPRCVSRTRHAKEVAFGYR
jgi:hypothetical protein